MGWVYMQRKFSMPSGVPVLDLNQRPPGCHSSRAAERRAGSEGSGSRPVQLVGLQGPGECQGLASSSSPPFIIPPLRAINKAASGERWRKQSCFNSSLFFSGLSLTRRGCREGVGASVASVRDPLFSSQRLSNQYLPSPSVSVSLQPPRKKGPSTTQDALS